MADSRERCLSTAIILSREGPFYLLPPFPLMHPYHEQGASLTFPHGATRASLLPGIATRMLNVPTQAMWVMSLGPPHTGTSGRSHSRSGGRSPLPEALQSQPGVLGGSQRRKLKPGPNS